MLVRSVVALASIAVAAAQVIKGKAFDHIFIIFLENTDFAMAATNPDLTAFDAQGILLNNYYSVTHPSEPNYIAVTGGDYFGMNDNAMHAIPSSYRTIVDLLEAKGLTWRAYQENAPSACFQDSQSGGLYFRSHNPFIIYDSISQISSRCNNIVPDSQLQVDLAMGALPNYAFYTPNVVHDGQNTTVADGSKWLTTFLTPLLANKAFLNNTLVVLTFDESESYMVPNRVYTLLLGDAVTSLKATTDSTFYTHYSLLSTVEANWDLGNLGRHDTNTTVNNVFGFVAKAAGITTNNNISMANAPLMNSSEPGFLASSPPSQPGITPPTSGAQVPPPTSLTPLPPSMGSSTKAIIGGVSAGVVLVSFLVGYFVYRHRQSKRNLQKVPFQHKQEEWSPPQNGDPSLSHKIHIQHPGGSPSSLPPMSQPGIMSQQPPPPPVVFQQQFVFSNHPAPKVSTYGYKNQQERHPQQQQQPVPLIWEPQPFVPSGAASSTR